MDFLRNVDRPEIRQPRFTFIVEYVHGDSPQEIKDEAERLAREFFGDKVPLEVGDCTVTPNPANPAQARFQAFKVPVSLVG